MLRPSYQGRHATAADNQFFHVASPAINSLH
jgi:hypothetical protein